MVVPFRNHRPAHTSNKHSSKRRSSDSSLRSSASRTADRIAIINARSPTIGGALRDLVNRLYAEVSS